VLTPGGDSGIYGVVDFKNIAVGVLAVSDEQILMVKQFRYVLQCDSLEIPEGGCQISTLQDKNLNHPANEKSLLDAAKRELLEETGYSAKTWQPFLTLDLSNSVTTDHARVFLAEDLIKASDPNLESSESDLVFAWYPIKEIWEMIESGKIRDAITVAAITKYLLRAKIASSR